MRYVAAYLLAALGGNESPSAESIEKILSSVGIEAESDKLNKVISELKGKDLPTLIAEGNFFAYSPTSDCQRDDTHLTPSFA